MWTSKDVAVAFIVLSGYWKKALWKSLYRQLLPKKNRKTVSINEYNILIIDLHIYFIHPSIPSLTFIQFRVAGPLEPISTVWMWEKESFDFLWKHIGDLISHSPISIPVICLTQVFTSQLLTTKHQVLRSIMKPIISYSFCKWYSSWWWICLSG